jgi:hypothetical protein
LENLPELVSEIWTVLGESGESFRKSIIWAIETVMRSKIINICFVSNFLSFLQLKEKFNKLIELINSLRTGESNVHLTGMLDNLRENYDKVTIITSFIFTINII